MSEQDDMKEWVKVTRSARGQTTVTVSLVRGNVSSKWTVRTYGTGELKAGVAEARKYATKALAEVEDAITEAAAA